MHCVHIRILGQVNGTIVKEKNPDWLTSSKPDEIWKDLIERKICESYQELVATWDGDDDLKGALCENSSTTPDRRNQP